MGHPVDTFILTRDVVRVCHADFDIAAGGDVVGDVHRVAVGVGLVNLQVSNILNSSVNAVTGGLSDT